MAQLALRGAAKAAYMNEYMPEYMRFRRAYASPRRRLQELDMHVLELSVAEYTAQEIAEALGLTQAAVRGALVRVASYLAPAIPPPRLMVNLDDCLPFNEERFSGAS